MKILYLHQYFNTPNMPGSTRSYEFSKRLVKKGHEVHMVTTNWQLKSKNKFSIEDGINVHWAQIQYSNKMNFNKRLICFFRYMLFAFKVGMKLDYDVIIASSTPLTVGIPAYFLKKIKKSKLIFEVRDLWPQLPIALKVIKSPLLIKFLKFIEKKIYLESNKIIALSDGMSKEIAKVTNDTKKIVTITNICDIDKFRISSDIGRKFIKKNLNISSKHIIAYTGAFGKINNAIYLIDIANELKKSTDKIKFLMAGDGIQKKDIYNRAYEFGLLNETVFLFDYFPKNVLPKVISGCSITSSIFNDLKEMENNSANKFFDGLAAGKPIMLNYGGWQSELIRKSEAGFIIPNNNSKNAASIIKSVIFKKNKMNKMSKMSKKLSQNFSIDLCFFKLYKSLNKI